MSLPAAGRFPLLPRKKRSDKSSYGHALVAGGSDAMPGAAALTARATLVSGAGLVTLASTRHASAVGVARTPELLTLPLPACAGAVRGSAAARVFRYAAARRVNAAAVGPGLSVEGGAPAFARALAAGLGVPFVLDADGLNAFRGRPGLLKKRKAPAVLTPHDREFERVFGERPPEEAAARRRLVKRFARAYDIVLLLKGHRTLVSDGRRLYENRSGGPELAKAGSGDVLTGMLAAFLAQGLAPFEAAAWAAYLHGRAGERAARRTSELSVTASALLAELPAAFRAA